MTPNRWKKPWRDDALPQQWQHEDGQLDRCEAIIAGYRNGPRIEHLGFEACYQPLIDHVTLPWPSCFISREYYYATLFHELIHSTGHRKRLNRYSIGGNGPISFSETREELVAIIGELDLIESCELGKEVASNSRSWFEHYSRGVRRDILAWSSKRADAAVEHILGE